jgi:uncharacterized RmlC-like cupin family protein
MQRGSEPDAVTDTGDCVVIRGGDVEAGVTGLAYFVGISHETAGARRLCLQLVRVPPGGRANAHAHRDHETAVYVLEGEVVTWYGERLAQHMVTRAGDFGFIPPGVPHVPVNYGDVEAVAVIARSDPNTQETVIARPDLDGLSHLDDPPV